MNATHDRIKSQSARVLDVIDSLVDRLSPAPAMPTPPPQVARRHVANIMKLWQFCAAGKCRRSRCCRGEPSHCLRYAMPLLPHGMIVDLLRPRAGRSARRAQRRPTNRAAISSTTPPTAATMPCL